MLKVTRTLNVVSDLCGKSFSKIKRFETLDLLTRSSNGFTFMDASYALYANHPESWATCFIHACAS